MMWTKEALARPAQKFNAEISPTIHNFGTKWYLHKATEKGPRQTPDQFFSMIKISEKSEFTMKRHACVRRLQLYSWSRQQSGMIGALEVLLVRYTTCSVSKLQICNGPLRQLTKIGIWSTKYTRAWSLNSVKYQANNWARFEFENMHWQGDDSRKRMRDNGKRLCTRLHYVAPQWKW